MSPYRVFFQLLYKELCFRHLYNIKAAGVLERVAAFEHYEDLFKFIIEFAPDPNFPDLPLEKSTPHLPSSPRRHDTNRDTSQEESAGFTGR